MLADSDSLTAAHWTCGRMTDNAENEQNLDVHWHLTSFFTHGPYPSEAAEIEMCSSENIDPKYVLT
jgi:hypothetical protein